MIQIQSSEGWFSMQSCDYLGCTATGVHLWPFAASNGYMTMIYIFFPETGVLYWQNLPHSRQWVCLMVVAFT